MTAYAPCSTFDGASLATGHVDSNLLRETAEMRTQFRVSPDTRLAGMLGVNIVTIYGRMDITVRRGTVGDYRASVKVSLHEYDSADTILKWQTAFTLCAQVTGNMTHALELARNMALSQFDVMLAGTN